MSVEKYNQQCKLLNAKHSLAYWAGTISQMGDFDLIIKIIDGIFNRELIDRSDEVGVQIADNDAYEIINRKLIETGVPIDQIAIKLLQINATDLLFNLTELIGKRAKLDEIGLMIMFYESQSSDLNDEKTLRYLKLLKKTLNNHDQIIKSEEEIKAKVESIFE